jgi:hypothetical protein
MSSNINELAEKIRSDIETNIFSRADELTILILRQNTILEEIRDILTKGEPLNARRPEPEPTKRQYIRRAKPKPKPKPFSTTRRGWKPPELEGSITSRFEIGKNV